MSSLLEHGFNLSLRICN